MNAYLSRQRDGKYMLTYLPPILSNVGNTGEKDFYIQYGEPIGFRFICPWGAKVIFGVELEPLQSVKVNIKGEAIL